MADKTIEAVLRDHTERLMGLSGVVGVGQAVLSGQPCVKVFVVSRSPALIERIGREIEGYPVVLEVTGEPRALGGP